MNDTYRAILALALPTLTIGTFAYSGEGEDHIAFEVNDSLIFRFDKGNDRAALAREVRVLHAVKTLLTVPTPNPTYVGLAEGFIGYPKLPGTPLLAVADTFDLRHWPDFARQLGGVLRAVNDAPAAPLADVLEEDVAGSEGVLSEARESFAAVRQHIPRYHRGAIEAFLDTVPEEAQFTPVFAHNDLGIEHILIDVATRQVTGIIDWGDAALADPAYDFGKLYRDLGAAVLDALLDEYQAGDMRNAIRRRAVFYARCGVLEELAFGIETGRDEYSAKSLTALPWLFS